MNRILGKEKKTNFAIFCICVLQHSMGVVFLFYSHILMFIPLCPFFSGVGRGGVVDLGNIWEGR